MLEISDFFDVGTIASLFDIIVGVILIFQIYFPLLNIFYYILFLKGLLSIFPSMLKEKGLEITLNIGSILDFLAGMSLFAFHNGLYIQIFMLIGLLKIGQGGYSLFRSVIGKG